MTTHPVVLSQFSEILATAERGAPDEPNVRCAILLGERYTIVFDTLYSPRDMLPVLEFAGRRQRPIIVVNSHADIDHAWGNAAFPLAPIIGHAACRERLLGAGDLVRQKQVEDPAEYETVVLYPPTITFSESMTIDAGGFSVALYHLPGHQRDCIVAHLPEQGILLGGDCIEVPIPLLNSGPLDQWAANLRRWARRSDVRVVIPSHGPISGTELLLANADYLDTLADGRDDGWQATSDTLPFYREAHDKNVRQAAALRETGGVS